jgi:S1-C subfamily serine protease
MFRKKLHSDLLRLMLALLFLNVTFAKAGDKDSTQWKKICDDFKDCKYVFKDNFKDNRNNWPLSNDAKNGLAELSPEGGLHLKTNTKIDFAQWIKLEIQKDEDFDVEGEFNYLGGTSNGYYGLVWGVKDWDNYQYFLINSMGYYTYGVRYEGLNVQSSGDLISSAILKGKNETNKLKVKHVGKKIYLTINGEILESYNYYSISGKRTGALILGSKCDVVMKSFLVQKEDDTAGKYATDKKDENFKGNGSGFLLSNKGYVVTNYHVVENSETFVVEITDENGKKNYTAEVAVKDANNDLAILKIIDKEYKPSNTAIPYVLSQSTADVGTQVFTLGFPMALTAMGKEVKFTDGKISAKTGYKGDIGSYQTSVPVQPGNSGGPLFDYEGKLIGIINAKITEADNVSYAIKVASLKNLIELLSEPIDLNNTNDLKNKTTEEKIKVLTKISVLVKTK